MIEILIGDKGRIDFSTPIHMTEEQQKKFLKLLNTLFEPVETEYVSEFRNDRLGLKEINSPWTAEEYRVLLEVDEYENIANKLGRTEMSVIMRAGSVIPRLLIWCEEKKLSIDTIKLEDIEQFLKEIEDKKLERRRNKKLRSETIKQIRTIINDNKEPCMVGDAVFYGGECKEGFHKGCKTCPRSKGLIKTEEQITQFNNLLKETKEE